MPRIITFGELMLRLQPYNYERFVQCDHVEFTFGGGEANVAVSLANYGMDAAFVTKLPAHAIGQSAVNSLRRYGVDTSMIVRGGERVGIYFNEKGASQRGSVCIYDRAYSAAKAGISNFTQWLATHFAGTGIRCNAIAPGFLVSAQNRALLFNEDGTPTARSAKILNGTPTARFVDADELIGATLFLCDDKAASAITGVVLPVDAGFAAYSGV